VEAKARQEAKGDTNDADPNIRDGGTLLVIYVCHLNVLTHLFLMLSFEVSIIFWNHGLDSGIFKIYIF
jgi:hypothetical protein